MLSFFTLALGVLLAATPAGKPAAQATLEAWLAAQNQGKFDAYAALYADKFTGVKRSGPRVRRMDRAAWLRDRQRMFRKPMTVEMSKLAITLAGGVAQVTFVQRWASGAYQDEGPKRMLLVPGPGGFRIAQEEMQASTVERAYTATDAAMLMLGQALVLSVQPEPSWGVGPTTADAGRVGHQAVDARRLPPRFQRLAGQALEFFDAKARRCTAVIDGFELQARAEWHFVTLEEWKTAPAATIAAEVWAQGRLFLLARLRAKQGKCGEGVFGRLVGRDAAPVLPFVEAKGAWLGAARGAARALLGAPAATLTGFRVAAPATGPALAFLSVDPEACAPEAGLSAEIVWRVDGGPRAPAFTLVSRQESSFRQFLLAVPGPDGRWTVIYQGWPNEPRGLLTVGPSGYEGRLPVELPYFDCPC
jgi:ketosteroid isomerase-like protein